MSRWPTMKLAELTTKVGSGSTPRGGSDAYKSEGTPLIRSMNVHFDGVRDEGLAFIDGDQARALDGVTVRGGDVLLNITGASIGRVAVTPARFDGARVNQHVCIIRTREPLDAQFLKLFLNAPAQQNLIMEEESGATRQALTKEKILNFDVPLPPLNEQRRIVAKLEALQARSRRAREALDAVPPLLEKLRQSILAAAFRGDLTKDWRAKHKDVEPASELLKRIRAERKKKWEEAELAKMKAKGKPPTDDKWKAKYKEPAPVDTTGLPDLPEGWCWASLDDLVVEGPTNGFSPKSETDGTGTPTLKLSATTTGVCVLNDSTTKRTALPVAADEPYWLSPGDLLIQRGNTLEYVGVSAIFNGPERTYIYPDLMMRVRASSIGPHILWRALSWEFCRRFMRARATGTAGNMPKVNGETVRSVPIPLPPLAEQPVLLDSIDTSFTAQAGVVGTVSELAGRLRELERSLLATAFRGELVAQDPNDEPAEAMLARAEQELAPQTAHPVKRATKGRTRARHAHG